MINFRQIFTKEYLFYIDGAKLHPTDKIVFIVGIASLALGIVLRLVAWYASNPFAKRVWQKFGNIALAVGVLEVLWFGLRFQNVQVLASHTAAFLILVIGALWTIPTIKYLLRQYRVDVEGWKKEQVKQKYLPNSK
jgi:hypothetical protein